MTERKTKVRPKAKRTQAIVFATVLVIVAFVVVLATRPAANDTNRPSPLVGQFAPVVTGTAIDGALVDSANYRGRYVVVNFFATWCGPCRAEHPEIKSFTERHQGANAPVVIAVAYDDSASNVKSFFKKEGGRWPVLADDDGKTSVDYGVRALPETYVIDPSGLISAHIPGQITTAQLESLTGVL